MKKLSSRLFSFPLFSSNFAHNLIIQSSISVCHILLQLFSVLYDALRMKMTTFDTFFTLSPPIIESDGRVSSSGESSSHHPFPCERKINKLNSNGVKMNGNGVKTIESESTQKQKTSTSPLLHLVCDALGCESNVDDNSIVPKDELLFDPFANDATNDHVDNFIVHKVLMNGHDLLDDGLSGVANNLLITSRSSFEEREENLLSTVIEEEQEQDSLEEFIKHETECGCPQSSINGSSDNGLSGGGIGNHCNGRESGDLKKCYDQVSMEKMKVNEKLDKKNIFKRFDGDGDEVDGSKDGTDESNDGVCGSKGGRQKSGCDLLHDHDQLKMEKRNVTEGIGEIVDDGKLRLRRMGTFTDNSSSSFLFLFTLTPLPFSSFYPLSLIFLFFASLPFFFFFLSLGQKTWVKNIDLNGLLLPSSSTCTSLPLTHKSTLNGDGVKKGSFFHEPVTSEAVTKSNDAAAVASFELEEKEVGICESKVVPSSQLARNGKGMDERDDEEEDEGRGKMKRKSVVDNDQHHHDSFSSKIEKDSSFQKVFSSRGVRPENLKEKKVEDSTFSSSQSEVIPSTGTTATTVLEQPYTAGSARPGIVNSTISSLETDVVTQLCFEPVEVLVKDLQPVESSQEIEAKSKVEEEAKDDIPVSSSASKVHHPKDTMNGCNNKQLFSSTGAATVTGSSNKSREEPNGRHVMKSSHHHSSSPNSTTTSVPSTTGGVDRVTMNGGKKSANENSSSSSTLFKRSSSIKDLREKQNEAEIKIAKEILELKQREEELRIMRQEMNRMNSMRMVKEEIKAVPSDVSSVEIDGRCSPSSSEISTTESVSGRISVDSLESHSNCHSNSSSTSSTDHPHYNHHSKVKRLSNMKVKPFEEKVSENIAYFNQGMNSLMKKQESPIEREIRILKEREEELRLEKLKRCQGSGKC